MNTSFNNLIRSFSELPQVEAILLAGSRTNGTEDRHSDYDVYIYTSGEIAVETRRKITDQYCEYMELNNQFWETEDDGYLREGHVGIELIYRTLAWMDGMLEPVVFGHKAEAGYTTCFWSNLLSSKILFDRHGAAATMVRKYTVAYPPQLQSAIIHKNWQLLKSKMPAYYHQIEKAIGRQDRISVNHRIAAFLASYFDILFALNEMPHPGEKKMMQILVNQGRILPKDFQEDMDRLMDLLGDCDQAILTQLDKLIDHLWERITCFFS